MSDADEYLIEYLMQTVNDASTESSRSSQKERNRIDENDEIE